MKYTPGPWKVEECYDGKYEMTSPGETLEDTRLIGVIEPACNIKNDAPLIEAAPDLLETTKENMDLLIEKVCKKCDVYSEKEKACGELVTCSVRTAIVKTANAIIKATSGDE